MNDFAFRMLLLADRSEIFRDMGSGFREKRESFQPTDLLWWLLAAALIAAAFVSLAAFLSRQDKHRLFNSPRALFNALCKAHKLDRSSRNLLKQLATAQEMAIPARLFLEPDRFEPAQIPAALQNCQPQYAQLKERLFAAALPSSQS